MALQARLSVTACLVFSVWRVLVILINDLHDEGNERFDKYLTALREVAPFLEKIHQLLAKVALTMMVPEEL